MLRKQPLGLEIMKAMNFDRSCLRQKNEEIVIEMERQRRKNNIVIHGIQENSEDTVDRKKQTDEEFVTSLFQILGVSSQPKTLARLGKATETN